MRKRCWTDEQLVAAVQSSGTYAEIIRKLGLSVAGGTWGLVKLRIQQLGLDISHFNGRGWRKNKQHPKYSIATRNPKPLEEILVEESTYSSTHGLKHRLWKAGLLERACGRCGLGPEWNGQGLSLQLDHINGVRTDNRIENLRILCPNCHSQTDTFAGKRRSSPTGRRHSLQTGNSVGSNPTSATCKMCHKQIHKKSQLCKTCHWQKLLVAARNQKTKIQWPSTNTLIEMVEQTSYLAVGRQLGVSDKAVKKRIQNHAE